MRLLVAEPEDSVKEHLRCRGGRTSSPVPLLSSAATTFSLRWHSEKRCDSSCTLAAILSSFSCSSSSPNDGSRCLLDVVCRSLTARAHGWRHGH